LSAFHLIFEASFPCALYLAHHDTDYFSVRKAGLLPNSVPTESCKAVFVLFEQANISLPTDVTQFINTVTVKEIVYGIMRWKCVTADKGKGSIEALASECGTSIAKVVLDAHTSSQAVKMRNNIQGTALTANNSYLFHGVRYFYFYRQFTVLINQTNFKYDLSDSS
jgi:hypothetical protein